MPSTTDILSGLTRISNDAFTAAVLWHALIAAAVFAAMLGWRPSRRTVAIALSAPLLSVARVRLGVWQPLQRGGLRGASRRCGLDRREPRPRPERTGTTMGRPVRRSARGLRVAVPALPVGPTADRLPLRCAGRAHPLPDPFACDRRSAVVRRDRPRLGLVDLCLRRVLRPLRGAATRRSDRPHAARGCNRAGAAPPSRGA